MAADKYRHAEDEYFKLRGQFDTGRLSQEDFDTKLRDLMVQDEQGRYWMLGADSGKWYFYDGAKWVTGDPYPGATTAANAPTEIVPTKSVAPISSPPPTVAATFTPAPKTSPSPAASTQGQSRGSPILLILILIVLLLLAAAAFYVFQNRGSLLSVAQQPTPITPILPPTITRAPSPTFVAVQPTVAQATLPPLPTAIPDTQVADTTVPTVAPTNTPETLPTTESTTAPTAAATIVVVTSIPPTAFNSPTLLPTVTNPPPPSITPIPTTQAPTAIPPTNTPSINAPPGVYVTNISTDPSAPKRNQSVTFNVTFANNTGSNASYTWLILLFDPNKVGSNKGFGESPTQNIVVPNGTSQFSVSYVAVIGPGGCKSLYAQAAIWISKFDKRPFNNTNGTPTSLYFDVCP